METAPYLDSQRKNDFIDVTQKAFLTAGHTVAGLQPFQK